MYIVETCTVTNTQVRVARAGGGRGLGSGRGGEESQDPLRRMEPLELWGREDRGGAGGDWGSPQSGFWGHNVRRQV